MLKIQRPRIVRGVLSDADFRELRGAMRGLDRATLHYERASGRHLLHSSASDVLTSYHERLLPYARAVFGSDTLRPAHAMFAHYEGATASLERHRDTNSCDYTLDLCLYQEEPWDMWVVDQPYAWSENEALAFCGSEQEHWRGAPPPDNGIGLVFFHFVEPDHWLFTIGRRHQSEVEALDRLSPGLAVPEHRVFVAHAVSARSCVDFYARVRQRFPDDDPVDKVFAWVEELCGPRVERSPLGLKLNATTLRVAKRLAQRATAHHIARELSKIRREPVTEAQVAALERELRGSLLSIVFP